MRRELTGREKLLLVVLGILLAVSGYFLLFYTPMKEERERCLAETENCTIQIEAANIRLEEKRRMERELEELFSKEPPPLSIPDYDNREPVMFELHSILTAAMDYSLSFSTVDASQTIVRRSISMNFTAPGYEAARDILRKLHDCSYRCLLDNLVISFAGDSVSVNGTIVFFEYRKDPARAAE